MSIQTPYVGYEDVVLGHDALTRDPLSKDVVLGIINESATKVEADLSGYLDIAQIREMKDPHPVVKVLVLAMARERAYSSLYGSNLPEDGGQVARWKREYDALLFDVIAGKYERSFGSAVREPRNIGTVKAV